VRRYAPSLTSSTPGTALAARWPNNPSYANGVRTGRRSDSVPALPSLRPNRVRARWRRAVGVRSHTARTVSLNCRMLEKPAAKATSLNGNSVVSMSTRAVCVR
jgi:hypothetical protein